MSFEFNITGDLNAPSLPENPINPDAMGGTELLREGLFSRLPPELKSEYNFMLSKVRDEFFDDRKSILWLHDLPEDPESAHLRDKNSRDRFAKLVFVSNWQQYSYHMSTGIPYEDGVVINNPIEPIPVHKKPKGDKIRLIYFSTPHRGLAILEPAVRLLSQHRDDFEVDVYSSFELYGWKGEDEHPHFKELYDRLNDLDCVNYHGTVSNDEIREALQRAHIFAYPSIYKETSCLCAIESLAAGCLAVLPNYGALPETCGEFAWMYNWESNPEIHARKFASILNHAIDGFWNEGVQAALGLQVAYYNHYYSWNTLLGNWVSLLEGLRNEDSK
jgi:glycosyltransferase involved in cell wall biosynthesis